jgi:hypothetical protein
VLPVVRPNGMRNISDVVAGSATCLEPSFGDELLVRLLHHRTSQSHFDGKCSGTWQSDARLELAAIDGRPDTVGYLNGQRAAVGSIDRDRQGIRRQGHRASPVHGRKWPSIIAPYWTMTVSQRGGTLVA